VRPAFAKGFSMRMHLIDRAVSCRILPNNAPSATTYENPSVPPCLSAWYRRFIQRHPGEQPAPIETSISAKGVHSRLHH
jgi:hypothetical protein